MRYGISSLDEARAYLAHEVLGPRLRECTRLVAAIDGRSADEIFGWPDNLKVRSSMTLFARATDDKAEFRAVLDKFYGGEEDPATVELLEQLGAMISQPCGSISASVTIDCGGAPDPATIRPSPKPSSGSDNAIGASSTLSATSSASDPLRVW